MPIPKPKAGEPKNAYVSRCMGDVKVIEEFPAQDQRAAICSTTWKTAKMTAEAKAYEFDAEILAEGKWNGIDITRQIMDQMVTNFRALSDILDVPLKLGHNDQQAMTDGHPAIGWINDLWINDAGKMVARLTDMPEIVYNAVKARRYKNVSIEASLDVTHKGREYGAVLTGLALLGADLPAVNTLADLQTYMTAQNNLSMGTCVNFAAIGGSQSIKRGDPTMDHEKEIADLKAKLAQQEAVAIKMKAEKEAAAREAEELRKTQKAAKFAADVLAVKTELEEMVKAEDIIPAQRDALLAMAKDEDGLDIVRASVDVLRLSAESNENNDQDKNKTSNSQQGWNKDREDGSDDDLAPSEKLHAKAMKLSIEKDVSFSAAVDLVMLEDPELAKAYTTEFDQENAS